MSEDQHADVLQALAAWREHGNHPAHIRHLELLAQRLPSQPDSVRRILAGKLKVAMDELASRPSGQPAERSIQWAPPSCTPLAQLNQYIQDVVRERGEHTSSLDTRPELRSLQRFRETWVKVSAEDQVNKAMDRAPDNAGPLNSHQLVLRALALMRDLSPDYLRRFLSQVDTLLWLDQVSQKPTAADAKPARASKPKK